MKLKPNYHKIFFFLFIAIIIISSIPNLSTPKISVTHRFSIRTGYIFHLLEYLCFVSTFLLWQIQERKIHKTIYFLFVAILFVLFAFFDELHQKIIPGRICNPIDFIYDCAGIFLDFIIFDRRVKHKIIIR